MKSNYQAALDHIFEWEGGFVDHPSDPGGATNMGITIATLQRWRSGRPVTKQDVKDLTRAEASKIYLAYYWDAVRADELPSGLDMVMFDAAVNQGPGKAVRLLQEAPGVTTDGLIGPKTLGAANDHDAAKTINEFCVLRAMHYTGLSTFPVFGHGWFRRLFSSHAFAVRLQSKGTPHGQ